MKVIDLRSDTVTHPTNSMLAAMSNAELGDEGFSDDPTVNLLQEKVADMMGKEAALFMPSGTMANLSAILTHCERGDEIVLGDLSHIYVYEYGAASSLEAYKLPLLEKRLPHIHKRKYATGHPKLFHPLFHNVSKLQINSPLYH
jgi:threonine aldolase